MSLRELHLSWARDKAREVGDAHELEKIIQDIRDIAAAHRGSGCPEEVSTADRMVTRKEACAMLNEFPASSCEWLTEKYGLKPLRVGVGFFYVKSHVLEAKK